jgi:hypothetical protein
VKLANIGARAALVLGGEIADIAKLSSGRFGPDLMTMTWPGPLPASARVTTSPRAGSSSGVEGRRRP